MLPIKDCDSEIILSNISTFTNDITKATFTNSMDLSDKTITIVNGEFDITGVSGNIKVIPTIV